jgi:hypothetical protein
MAPVSRAPPLASRSLRPYAHRGIFAYPNVIYFNEVDKGGRFAAWEEPGLFSEELRAAFRPLR